MTYFWKEKNLLLARMIEQGIQMDKKIDVSGILAQMGPFRDSWIAARDWIWLRSQLPQNLTWHWWRPGVPERNGYGAWNKSALPLCSLSPHWFQFGFDSLLKPPRFQIKMAEMRQFQSRIFSRCTFWVFARFRRDLWTLSPAASHIQLHLHATP